jgi:SAM-dependent methyltransferase
MTVARGPVSLGDLRRLSPVSRVFGFDRGTPIDRHYIEGFLNRHREDVRGRVLEVGDRSYTERFGEGRVTRSDVLHPLPGNRQATLVGDLVTGEGIPADAFDCVILTQVLNVVSDPRRAIAHAARALASGGVLLATFPGITAVSRFDMDRWGDYWRFTTLSARRCFQEAFPADHVRVETHGNVLAAVAFLHGLAAEELQGDELDHRDPDFEVLIAIRAVQPKP